MSTRTEPTPSPQLPIRRPKVVLAGVIGWAAWVSVATTVAAWTGWLDALPGTALAAALAVGACATRPYRAAWAPVVVVGAVAAAWLAEAIGLSPVMGAGLVAGWWVVRASEHPSDRLDRVNGALAGAAFAGIGLWASQLAATTGLQSAAIGGAILGAISALALIPHALTLATAVPRKKIVEMTLTELHREAPLRALRLFRTIKSARPDRATQDRLAELTTWVYRLAQSLQTLEMELAEVDEIGVRERISALRAEVENAADDFTSGRLAATADHMEGLLDHASRLGVERRRIASLQDCALASLEEARLGVALSRSLPGEHGPTGLDDVLRELREHAREVGRERATRRELQRIPTY